MFKLEQGENSHRASKTIILSFLILIFITIALLVISKNAFVINLDSTINTLVLNNQSPYIRSLMLSITSVGDAYGTIIIFLVFGLFLFSKNKKSFYTFAISTFSGVALMEIIKYLVRRPRPYNLIEQGSSFPSAHSTVAIIFLLSSIFLLAPMIKNTFSKNVFLLVTCITFPLVILSRIYLSVHWTSDVLAAIILGSICFMSVELISCYKKENML